MERFFVSLLLWTAVSCTLVELDEGKQDSWQSPVPETGNLYVLGLDYPAAYDWRENRGDLEIPCSLVLWSRGRKLLRLPVGEAYGISPDPDACRFIGGILYTDWSGRSETVIKANGQELFRYPGREEIVGFAVEGEEVYTLGNSRDGRGFSFRRNGELIIGGHTGRAYPHLEGGDGKWTFCFREPETGEDAPGFRYYMFDGKEKVPLLLPEEVMTVYDAMVADGRAVVAAAVTHSTYPALVRDGNVLLLEADMEIIGGGCSCFLHHSGDGSIYVYSTVGMLSNFIWKEDTCIFTSAGYSDMSGFRTYGEDFLCYLMDTGVMTKDALCSSGRHFEMPQGYTVFGEKPLCLWQGKTYAALTSREGRKPLVWCEGKSEEVDINGCLYEIGVFQ